MLQIDIDREVCIGSGNCAFWAGSTFDLDDDGYAVVVDPTGDDRDLISKAAAGCPTRAITLSED